MKHESTGPSKGSRTSSLTKIPRVRLREPSQKPIVPKEVRALLGPSWILEGEDPELYERLLAEIGAAVQPEDFVDWLLVMDIAAVTWEIQHTRRQRDSLMRLARHAALKTILSTVLPKGPMEDMFDDASLVAMDWHNGDEQVKEGIERIVFDQAGLSAADVTTQSLSTNAVEFDRLDAQNKRHEDRRDALLQQIERRRSGWANKVRRASEEIVDAEFKESTPSTVTGAYKGEKALLIKMTSSRQLYANRRNARRSTGPQTAAGKAAARLNARRHGLAVPLRSEPGVDHEIERLADAIAGARSDLMDLARRIAEADLELRRIRRARRERAKKPRLLTDPSFVAMNKLVAEGGEEIGCDPPPALLRWEKRLLDQEVIAFERYERRALSRRKFAIRDFDAARLSTPDPGLAED